VDEVNHNEALVPSHDRWCPEVVEVLNGQRVTLARFQGEFVWHQHEDEDELLMVVKGRFRMEFRDQHVWLEEAEFLIVPRGVEHRPVAEEEVQVLLFENSGTLKEDNTQDERMVEETP